MHLAVLKSGTSFQTHRKKDELRGETEESLISTPSRVNVASKERKEKKELRTDGRRYVRKGLICFGGAECGA